MTDARAVILEKLRAAQVDLPQEAKVPELPHARTPSLDDFVAAAKSVDAEVSIFKTLDEAKQALAQLTEGKQVFAWDKLPGTHRSTDAGAIHCEIGLTQPAYGIADTGSLVHIAGPGKSRLASLAVRTHIALLNPDRLLLNLAEALKKISELGDSAAHINIITGPSRTADIEMTLTKGVHGPKRLLILVAPWELM